METLGQRIQRLRKARKLTQVRLAEMVGATQGTISQYEDDSTSPPVGQLKLLAAALGVADADLFDKTPAQPVTREPSEIELLSRVVERFDIHPTRKSLILGLLEDLYLEQERADVIEFVLNAEKLGDVREVLKTVNGLKALRNPKKKSEEGVG